MRRSAKCKFMMAFDQKSSSSSNELPERENKFIRKTEQRDQNIVKCNSVKNPKEMKNLKYGRRRFDSSKIKPGMFHQKESKVEDYESAQKDIPKNQQLFQNQKKLFFQQSFIINVSPNQPSRRRRNRSEIKRPKDLFETTMLDQYLQKKSGHLAKVIKISGQNNPENEKSSSQFFQTKRNSSNKLFEVDLSSNSSGSSKSNPKNLQNIQTNMIYLSNTAKNLQNQKKASQAKQNINEKSQKQIKSINVVTQQQPINAQNSIKSSLIHPVCQLDNVLSFKIKRDKSYLNYFSPEFNVEFDKNKQFAMAAKKTFSKPISTFVFSCEKQTFAENSKSYLGKMKSNITGNILNIFGPGLSPQAARLHKNVPRQLLATIQYDCDFLGVTNKKHFKVFLKDQQFSYYEDFPEVSMYNQEIPLSELYNNPNNQNKISVFKTREPVYKAEISQYVLDFKGKIKMPSVKNFILYDIKDPSKDSILFGKLKEDLYHLDVHSPFTPTVGLAIAMNRFDNKISCQ